MKKAFLFPMAVLFISGCTTLGGSMESAIIRAKDKVAPALVHVRPVKEIYTSGKREEISVVGSGFVISPDGYVVTNEHVAGESKFVRCVLSDKEEVDAEVVGTDPYTDIAVLKLKTLPKGISAVKMGSSAQLEAGETVLAFGSPHGLARSVSMGIVSVTDRYLEDRGDEMVSPFNTWIQTDAAINPGNSGGPLVNLQGEVIGINSRILAGAENVGFAIPIDIAKEVITQIRERGRVERSWIGEVLQPMRAKTEDPSQKGVVIADVDPLSPGFEAGLRPGDVMLSLEGKPVNARFEEDLPPVRKAIAGIPIGTEATIHVLRGEQELDVKVKTVERSQLKGNQHEFTEWAFTAVDLTESAVRKALLSSKKGILITGSQVGGIAANAHLQNGDIVLKVDGEEIPDLSAFEKRYREVVAEKKRLVMLEVKRGALSRFAVIKQEAEEGGGTPPPTESAPAQPVGGDGHVE